VLADLIRRACEIEAGKAGISRVWLVSCCLIAVKGDNLVDCGSSLIKGPPTSEKSSDELVYYSAAHRLGCIYCFPQLGTRQSEY
jgi:hypothetical protein